MQIILCNFYRICVNIEIKLHILYVKLLLLTKTKIQQNKLKRNVVNQKTKKKKNEKINQHGLMSFCFQFRSVPAAPLDALTVAVSAAVAGFCLTAVSHYSLAVFLSRPRCVCLCAACMNGCM